MIGPEKADTGLATERPPMTPEEYLAGVEPYHLAEVRWYRVQVRPHGPAIITEHRAVFYLDCVPWDDHPWSEGRKGFGADFHNHWAYESRYSGAEEFRSTGRSNDGWARLEAVLSGSRIFATFEEAAQRADRHVDASIESLAENVERLRELPRWSERDWEEGEWRSS